jgi:hypothetical protein
MSLLMLCLGFEIPKLCSSLAISYPNYRSVSMLYYLATAKYCIWDVYQYQKTNQDNVLLCAPFAVLLLLNIGRFCNSVSYKLRKRLQNEFYTNIDLYLSSIAYLGQALTVGTSGYVSPECFICYMTMAITTNTYYTNRDSQNSYYDYFFYITCQHFLKLMQIWSVLQRAPYILYGCVGLHVAIFAQQIRIYYFSDIQYEVNEFLSHLCTCIDFFMLHLCTPTANMFEMWTSSVELYTMFMLLYFETFGNMTHCITRLIVVHHCFVVYRLCNTV